MRGARSPPGEENYGFLLSVKYHDVWNVSKHANWRPLQLHTLLLAEKACEEKQEGKTGGGQILRYTLFFKS